MHYDISSSERHNKNVGLTCLQSCQNRTPTVSVLVLFLWFAFWYPAGRLTWKWELRDVILPRDTVFEDVSFQLTFCAFVYGKNIRFFFSGKQLTLPGSTGTWFVPASSITFVNFGRGQTKVRVSRTAARGANLYEMYRRRWKNRKCIASKFRFPHAKEFLPNIICGLGWCLQNFCDPSRRPKKC